MKKVRRENGFTLVELVIVISVIAILAAVLIPTFVSVMRNSHQTAAEIEGDELRAQIISVFEDFDVFCRKSKGADGKTVTIPSEEGVDAKLDKNVLKVGDTTISLYDFGTEDADSKKNILITELKDKDGKTAGSYQLQYITKSGYTVTITADNDITAERKADPLQAA